MIKEVGSFHEIVDVKSANRLQLDLSKYSIGVNECSDFFFKLNEERQVEWVVSRRCDHNGGKLSLNECKHIAKCPLHGWKLNLNTLQYINVQTHKNKMDFKQVDNFLLVDSNKYFLQVPEELKTEASHYIKIRFLSHASLAITIDDFTIVTDPWLVGPCFMNGWWHNIVPKEDAMDILLNADLVYISHNHPDHMHAETLSYLKAKNPMVPIVVPDFLSQSVIRPLESYGFKNVLPLTFKKLYLIKDNILISILKSGDFRDDSGLFFASGNFSGLLTVDAAALNNMVLPRNVDFLATAFAGGSSGFPWCFDHYTLAEREAMCYKFRRVVIKTAIDYIKATEPKNYMPYAGYFSEEAERDKFIKINNIKNTVHDIKEAVTRFDKNINFIDPIETDVVTFDIKNATLNKEKTTNGHLYCLNKTYINTYLNDEKSASFDFSPQVIIDYFVNSQFNDDLIVYLVPSDDNFEQYLDGYRIDFSNSSGIKVDMMSFDVLLMDYEVISSLRKKIIKVRKDALWKVVKNYLSWEELSIGFQCRVIRRPDVYNSKFWDHFTNIYTKN